METRQTLIAAYKVAKNTEFWYEYTPEQLAGKYLSVGRTAASVTAHNSYLAEVKRLMEEAERGEQ